MLVLVQPTQTRILLRFVVPNWSPGHPMRRSFCHWSVYVWLDGCGYISSLLDHIISTVVDRLRYVLSSLLDHSRSTVVDRLRYVLSSLLDHRSTVVDRLRYVLPSLLDHSRSTLGGPVEICTILTVGSQQIYSSWWTGWDMYYPHCWITAADLPVEICTHLGGPVEICTILTVGSQQIYSSWWTGWDMYYPHCWITADLLWWTGWDMYYPHCWITADLL